MTLEQKFAVSMYSIRKNLGAIGNTLKLHLYKFLSGILKKMFIMFIYNLRTQTRFVTHACRYSSLAPRDTLAPHSGQKNWLWKMSNMFEIDQDFYVDQMYSILF